MASALALGPVCAAILTRLKADAGVTALVPSARIVDEMPQPPTYPLILVESQGETPFNTLGPATAAKYGSETRVGVRVLSQYRSDTETHQIASAIRASLEGYEMTLSGYVGRPILTFEAALPMFKTAVNLVVTRELLSEYGVTVHQ